MNDYGKSNKSSRNELYPQLLEQPIDQVFPYHYRWWATHPEVVCEFKWTQVYAGSAFSFSGFGSE